MKLRFCYICQFDSVVQNEIGKELSLLTTNNITLLGMICNVAQFDTINQIITFKVIIINSFH
jgi:hypothetical protein